MQWQDNRNLSCTVIVEEIVNAFTNMIFFQLITLLTLVVLGLMMNQLSAFILRLNKKYKYSKRCETTTIVQLNSKDYGVSFTGAGLLTPFHLGVSAYLSDEIKLIKDNTMLAGSR